MVRGWLLLLVVALPQLATGAKECVFCDLTDSSDCAGIPMTCGDDEECFIGEGTAPGLSNVINKGCMETTSCGNEEAVTYQGATYSLISTCCDGELCNRAPIPAGSLKAGATTGLALGVQLLLH
ncbi:PREDICTED: sperm acrosome membrane-associated protein 4-like [Myotis brandtii]|uniref:sperm acrosome membrane-associated protein 4-like n=1 Tax=Myotis brandtii TaxID=109478 RepID=UPI0003BB7E6F|nr:PREDICTED: sperm acrosome membrane-associated protein 4-like [Myotis brandtii]